MKSILITGAFGYVGGRLSKYLSESGQYQLFLTSRKKRDLPLWTNGAQLVQYCLGNKKDIFASLPSIDVAIHLASINEVMCSKSPELAVELNTVASFKLIQDAVKAGVKRFVYFSTAHVYGSPLKGYFDEESVTRPTHPYSYSHRAVEDYVTTANDQGKMEGVNIRLSNSLGAPDEKDVDRWMLLVSDLCRQAVVEGSLELKSYGSQKRDFIGLEDVCRGTEHLINLQEIGNGVFNLGGNYSISVYDMACLIAERASHILGKEIPVVRPEGKTENWELEYSVKKLESTGFELKKNVQQEIDNLLLFCQQSF